MANKRNIFIDQGTDYETSITLRDEDGNPLDLTGYSAASQFRKHYTSSNAIAFGTSINATAGTITLNLGAANTAAILPGRYVYDVEVTSSSNVVSRVIEGIVTITPGVTQ